MSLITLDGDQPTYKTRQQMQLGALAAGSAGVTGKFVAFAAMQLYSLSTYVQTLGTSTYSGTKSGQQVNVITVVNTSTTGTSVALSTTTYGPFLAGGQGLATAAIGGYNQFQINTATDTTGFGGVPIPAGSLVYCVSGTDATAVTVCAIDFKVSVGSPLMI